MSAHTQEPWLKASWGGIEDANGVVLAKIMQAAPTSNETCKANHERIIACVNACAGIADPSAMRDWMKQVEELINEINAHLYLKEDIGRVRDMASDCAKALARLEGGAK